MHTQPLPIAGWTGFALGAVALLLVLVHVWAGPFSARPYTVGHAAGEILVEVGQGARRRLTGASQAKPAPSEWTIDRVLRLVAAVLCGATLMAGAIGLIRREDRLPAMSGITLGATAIAMQFFVWAILVVAVIFIVGMALLSFTGIFGSSA